VPWMVQISSSGSCGRRGGLHRDQADDRHHGTTSRRRAAFKFGVETPSRPALPSSNSTA
jgi:hypothetical protein